MTAPGSVELDEDVLVVLDGLAEVLVVQHQHAALLLDHVRRLLLLLLLVGVVVGEGVGDGQRGHEGQLEPLHLGDVGCRRERGEKGWEPGRKRAFVYTCRGRVGE